LGFSLSSYQFLSEYESVFAFCGYQYRKAGRAAVSSSQPRCDDRQLIFLPEGSPPPQPLPPGAIEAVFPNVPYEEAKTGA